MWNPFGSRQSALTKRLAGIDVVVCDIDGTLLSKEGDIYSTTVDLVAQLRDSGIKFILSSGRCPMGVRDIREILDLREPYIALDGAVVMNEQDITIQELGLSASLREQLSAHSAKLELSVTAIHPTGHTTVGNPYAPGYIQHEDLDLRTMESLEELFALPALRYYVTGLTAQLEALHSATKRDAVFQKECSLSLRESKSRPGSSVMELRPLDADKGQSLLWLQQRLELQDTRIAVIGDYRNDLPMFLPSYFCVTLSDAVAELRSRAHYICSEINDEDETGGVDDFLSALIASRKSAA